MQWSLLIIAEVLLNLYKVNAFLSRGKVFRFYSRVATEAVSINELKQNGREKIWGNV